MFIEGIPSLPAGFYDVKEFVITISSTSSSSSVLYPTLLCIRLLFSPSLRLFFCPWLLLLSNSRPLCCYFPEIWRADFGAPFSSHQKPWLPWLDWLCCHWCRGCCSHTPSHPSLIFVFPPTLVSISTQYCIRDEYRIFWSHFSSRVGFWGCKIALVLWV